MTRNIMIIGASRGIGAAIAHGLPRPGDNVWLVSRGRPTVLDVEDGVTRTWVQADLTSDDAIPSIVNAIDGQRLDVLVYNAGIWERDAWSPSYDFATMDPAENQRILTVNLTAAIHALQALIPNLRQSDKGKIVLIGSVNGLPNATDNLVGYAASKFGLRGVAHALRDELRQDKIGVTIINPGSVGTSVPYGDGLDAALSRYGTSRVPLVDLVAVVRCAVDLSAATVMKEIDLPAMDDASV
jgi:short-subunit dehydrogenase